MSSSGISINKCEAVTFCSIRCTEMCSKLSLFIMGAILAAGSMHLNPTMMFAIVPTLGALNFICHIINQHHQVANEKDGKYDKKAMVLELITSISFIALGVLGGTGVISEMNMGHGMYATFVGWAFTLGSIEHYKDPNS
jgi:hypothetical protein